MHSNGEKDFPFIDLWHEFERNNQLKYSRQTLITKHNIIRSFCRYVFSNGISFDRMTPETIQNYIETKKHLKPKSLYVHLSDIILFLRYLAKIGKCDNRLSHTILRPSIWTDAEIPSALPWDIVKMIPQISVFKERARYRNKAILLLLYTYGVRAGEICRLKLTDIDWENETIMFERTKNYVSSKYPLDVEVGNAIADYIRYERINNGGAAFLFLQDNSATRSITPHSIWMTVNIRLRKIKEVYFGHHGPHSIRHAVAQHLLENGFSYKEIGDFLGHKHLVSTAIYAKIDFERLRKSALVNIADLLAPECNISSYYQMKLLSSTTNTCIENLGDLL